ncbi:MAG: Clp1/GlmU family protein [Actinomycetota bacterium]|nr:Clp1/GlmU family protein [Actinomycetota bacterium]
MGVDAAYEALRERVRGLTGVVMIIGGSEVGKTTLAQMLLRDAVEGGRTVAYVDGDLAAATVGPVGCIGMKVLSTVGDCETLSTPDELRFVGAIEPSGVVLPHVVGVAALVGIAKERADLVICDTTGVITGVVGQTLKYHLVELVHPEFIIAIRQGQELDPVIAMLRRFLSARVAEVEPPDDLVPASPTDRQDARAVALRKDIGDDPPRWRVQTTVFAPTLPDGFDVSRLDAMLVGVQDERGRCLGLGVLEHTDGTVSVATRYGDEMRGLRLGSIRVDLDTFATSRVRLRELIFGV